MSQNFSTIDAYLSSFADVQRRKGEELRAIIKHVAPEAMETINYNMPTFRYNGNLIHFALFKKHIGIYPGSEAVAAFEDQLSAYKHGKGSIQIPLEKSIPKDLITLLVQFNLERLKDKQAPNWRQYEHQWDHIVKIIRPLVEQTALVKAFKWGSDVYTWNGQNVLSFAGFKHHFALWFYKGVLLEDKQAVLVAASEGKTKSLRQWRFQADTLINETHIKAYIQEAIAIAQNGKELLAVEIAPLAPTTFFKEHLEKDSLFHAAFYKLSPGKQKDFISYIDEAKQEKTKIKRLDKIIPLILDGKGLHDKYKT